MKKKMLVLLLALVMVLPMTAGAMGAPKIWVKGEFIESDMPPVIEEGRTLVPIRFIGEALDFDVDWDQEKQTAILQRSYTQLFISIGEHEMIKREHMNGADKYLETTIDLDVPAKLIDDRTFIPLRAVAEAVEEWVEWDHENRVVVVGEGYESRKLSNENGEGEPNRLAHFIGTWDALEYDNGEEVIDLTEEFSGPFVTLTLKNNFQAEVKLYDETREQGAWGEVALNDTDVGKQIYLELPYNWQRLEKNVLIYREDGRLTMRDGDERILIFHRR